VIPGSEPDSSDQSQSTRSGTSWRPVAERLLGAIRQHRGGRVKADALIDAPGTLIARDQEGDLDPSLERRLHSCGHDSRRYTPSPKRGERGDGADPLLVPH